MNSRRFLYYGFTVSQFRRDLPRFFNTKLSVEKLPGWTWFRFLSFTCLFTYLRHRSLLEGMKTVESRSGNYLYSSRGRFPCQGSLPDLPSINTVTTSYSRTWCYCIQPVTGMGLRLGSFTSWVVILKKKKSEITGSRWCQTLVVIWEFWTPRTGVKFEDKGSKQRNWFERTTPKRITNQSRLKNW